MPKTAAVRTPPPAPPHDDATLTVDDVCRQMNVSRRVVRQLMELGLLRFVAVARLQSDRPIYRFRQSWIDDYVDRKKGKR